ncbi:MULTISPECIES: MFS transporter [Bacillus cereus group]|uniref:Putative proline/betaine transporter n=3 Tax=Bacillaceae TaxID=186817 RepID=A0A9X6KFS9_BACTU|nr:MULTISPECIES: MFS transporter [Bacillus cereus group]AGE76633.1 Alpha-ketoglutarate transporter, MFS super [Bacillus thuringiensis serovar kurstaki str. HD73]AHZ49795.1 alpha-ketoglutarate permease [Bacillus thuringiensis serovar kurstaki str. YBT-1520]AIM33624.1 alpha-ketoglutarate transporter, MFS super [Bacillus thuringiensis serovar kurstaki str. YBT-1520]AJK39577.1 sugar (and other) transporter family protein [Bacillus thuringiensis serovar kurstaki]AKJ58418.1 alpha-ketoglutarate trans
MAQAKSNRVAGNIFKGSVGNLIEWYDWYVYSAFAVYFSAEFFPKGDPTSQLLNTAAIFAVGFLMRPIGSLLMGRYADRHGRRAALTLSITVMAGGSFIIACTPSYESIGIMAPIILVLARLLQGLSLGGEYGTSATYLSEMASSGRRGFYSSFQYVTLVAGQMVALGVQIVLQQLLSEPDMKAWGWRIPFIIGAMGAVAVLWLRRTMDESEQFSNIKSQKRESAGTVRALMKHPKAVLTVVGLTLGGTVAFYTYTTYLQKFMVNTVGLPKEVVSWINFAALLIFVVLQPIAGLLSDKIGRRPLLMAFGILGTLLTAPIFFFMEKTTEPIVAFLLMMVGLIIVTGYTSINAIVKAELFPTEIRALGVGLPYALTVAIFGGTAEFIALWLKSIGMESLFYFYVAGCIAISFITYWRMDESSKTSQIEAELGGGDNLVNNKSS